MAIQTHNLNVPAYYSLAATCHAHGWIYLAPFDWDEERCEVRFAVLVGSQSVDVVCRQNKQQINVSITSHRRLTADNAQHLIASVRRALDLDRETAPLAEAARQAGPEFSRLLRKGAGRMLRAASLWEDAAKTLFTTNCTWTLTTKMAEAACSEQFVAPAPSGRFPFPSPETIAARSPAELKRLMPVGYRAAYLHAVATRFATDASLLDIEIGDDPDTAYALAKSLHGFGDYAASHLIILAGHFHRIPIDTVVSGFLSEAYRARNPKSAAERRYRAWGKYRWWGLKLDQMRLDANWIGD